MLDAYISSGYASSSSLTPSLRAFEAIWLISTAAASECAAIVGGHRRPAPALPSRDSLRQHAVSAQRRALSRAPIGSDRPAVLPRLSMSRRRRVRSGPWSRRGLKIERALEIVD